MTDISYIFLILQDSLLAIAIFLAILLSISILFIERFRHRNNMIIFNICFTVICCCVYFFIHFTLSYFDPQRLYAQHLCILLFYANNIANISIPFAFVTFTIHRYFFIIYHTKVFFKSRQWVIICIASQWILTFFLSLPFVFRSEPYCGISIGFQVYACIMTIIIPSTINIILNGLIFLHVRSSTRRVLPQVFSVINTGINSNQQGKIGRREIVLLQRMIFTFVIFILGWSPVYLSNIVNLYITVDVISNGILVLICEIAALSLVFNLVVFNRELRQYISDKIQFYFRH
ncbi:hypothetical protein I4U23_001437 [Adineta vaga]|nr:hypothetical protein I4U23_001437 [Adineta vaga]